MQKTCIDLIMNPRCSVIAFLDEACALNMERKEDPNRVFLAKITSTFMPDYQSASKSQKQTVLDRTEKMTKPADFFHRGRLDNASFIVRHYAGDVKYCVDGFVEKNMESVKDFVKNVLRSTRDERIASLFAAEKGGQSQKDIKTNTVGSAFRLSLKELMETIESTQPHWIRCIRPHPSKRPGLFDGRSVLEQLTAAGVLETIEMRQKNFPFRINFDEFWKRFSILIHKRKSSSSGAANCRCVLEAVGLGKNQKVVQIGRTKLFMAANAYNLLETARAQLLHDHVMVCQRY
jgi:myosin heavy subunit